MLGQIILYFFQLEFHLLKIIQETMFNFLSPSIQELSFVVFFTFLKKSKENEKRLIPSLKDTKDQKSFSYNSKFVK